MYLYRAGLVGLGLLLGVAFMRADDPPPQKDAKKKEDRAGEFNAPAARGERFHDTLKVDDPAPDFTLPDPTGERQVTLSGFAGKKPVVLVFGSCT